MNYFNIIHSLSANEMISADISFYENLTIPKSFCTFIRLMK